MLVLLSSSEVSVTFAEVVLTFSIISEPEVELSWPWSFWSDESLSNAKSEMEQVVVETIDREVTYIGSVRESFTSISSDADTNEEWQDSSSFWKKRKLIKRSSLTEKS